MNKITVTIEIAIHSANQGCDGLLDGDGTMLNKGNKIIKLREIRDIMKSR
jgi:hypothetical protein